MKQEPYFRLHHYINLLILSFCLLSPQVLISKENYLRTKAHIEVEGTLKFMHQTDERFIYHVKVERNDLTYLVDEVEKEEGVEATSILAIISLNKGETFLEKELNELLGKRVRVQGIGVLSLKNNIARYGIVKLNHVNLAKKAH